MSLRTSKRAPLGHPGPPSHWTLLPRRAPFEVLTWCNELAEFWMAAIRLLNGRDFIAGKGARPPNCIKFYTYQDLFSRVPKFFGQKMHIFQLLLIFPGSLKFKKNRLNFLEHPGKTFLPNLFWESGFFKFPRFLGRNETYYSTYIKYEKIIELPPKKYNHSAKIFSGILQSAQTFWATWKTNS